MTNCLWLISARQHWQLWLAGYKNIYGCTFLSQTVARTPFVIAGKSGVTRLNLTGRSSESTCGTRRSDSKVQHAQRVHKVKHATLAFICQKVISGWNLFTWKVELQLVVELQWLFVDAKTFSVQLLTIISIHDAERQHEKLSEAKRSCSFGLEPLFFL